jgi:hypothetical protein
MKKDPVKMFRETTYTLTGIQESQSGPMAIIDSTYLKSDEAIESIPVPYEGGYMPKGMFVILRGYNITSFEGSGSQKFDIDRGVVVDDKQNYKMSFDVFFPLPLGDSKPILTLDQKMSIELLDE